MLLSKLPRSTIIHETDDYICYDVRRSEHSFPHYVITEAGSGLPIFVTDVEKVYKDWFVLNTD